MFLGYQVLLVVSRNKKNPRKITPKNIIPVIIFLLNINLFFNKYPSQYTHIIFYTKL